MKTSVKVLFYSCRDYDKFFFRTIEKEYPSVECTYIESSLTTETVQLSSGYNAVCVFVEDDVNENIIAELRQNGVEAILLRCAGQDKVDLKAAESMGLKVMNVPAYSPESVAEHALALLMDVSRHVHRAYNRVKENNFSLTALNGYCLMVKL